MPTCFTEDGVSYWHKNGKLHRTDGPAIEHASGNKYWYKNGSFHRKDGPAIEYKNGSKYWYKNGLFHRTDGPAIEQHVAGDKIYTEWWVNGKQVSQARFASLYLNKETAMLWKMGCYAWPFDFGISK
jgi:hypothetical protein